MLTPKILGQNLRAFFVKGAAIKTPVHSGFALALILFACQIAGPSAHAAGKWEPVDPADLAMKDSVGFPGADIEILLSNHVMDERLGVEIAAGVRETEDRILSVRNYVRAKIYTAKGVEDQSKLSIQFPDDCIIKGTEARVIKPNGTITELKKSDIVENVLAKTKGGKQWKQITFVFPGLEAGDLVDYRWTEQVEKEIWLKVFFAQEAVPIREYRFTVSSITRAGSVSWFNCPKVTSNKKNGFTVTVRDQPAFESEENMPAELDFRGWICMAKSWPMYANDEEIWKELSVSWGDRFTDATRPNAAIKKKAEALTAGATTDQEKLQRLYEFCQVEIYNTTYRTSAELRAEIDKHKDEDPDSPVKVLEHKRGRQDEVNFLFASLARGLGFEVKEVRNAGVDEIQNVKILRGWAFLGRSMVAVKSGDQWSYFDPGSYLIPYGLVSWADESAIALLCGSKKLEFREIPGSFADKNQKQRKARLTLDAEGSLEGEVEETFTGHSAITRKREAWGDAIEEVNNSFRAEVTKRIPAAEVTDITWTNLDTNPMPVSVKYHVRVPGYAEQAGKRLVFAPAFFEVGAPTVFAAKERKYPVRFYYAWSEHDDIEIVLPAGYTLDKPSAPLAVGEVAGALGAEYKLQYNPKTRTFGYRRDFALGANGAFAFKLESYPALKELFEKIHKSDAHSIVLKPKAVAPAATTAAPSESAPAPGSQK